MSQNSNNANQLHFAFHPRIFPGIWRRRVCPLIGALLLVSSIAWAHIHASSPSDFERFHNRLVTYLQAVDANTIDIDVPDDHSKFTRISLLGTRPVELSEGLATAAMTLQTAQSVKSLVENQKVRIVLSPQQTRDAEGRLLAYVYLPAPRDDVMLNEEIIARGLASADRFIEHPWRFRFRQLEDRARKQRPGPTR